MRVIKQGFCYQMKDKIVNPTILLLSNAIVYQRIENKLSSLDPLLMQEFEYLKNTIGKISIYKPDILLVEKTVSRVAQEMLLDLGITVALNVKPVRYFFFLILGPILIQFY